MSHNNEADRVLNIAIYPWFAIGHLTSFLRLANKLTERGHKVSYFLPAKTRAKLASQNHFPDHLTFIPVTVPHVDGLPPGAETTNDASVSAAPLIMAAMNMTRDTIEAHLVHLKPDFILYDFAYWMPELARKHGIKSMHYITGLISRCAGLIAYIKEGHGSTGADEVGHPSPIFRKRPHEAKVIEVLSKIPFGPGGLTLPEMWSNSFQECDAIGVKTCKEMEGDYCEFVEKKFCKPVLLAGPVVPQAPTSKLDEYFDGWLNGFDAGSVIFCALESQCALDVNQFQEIVLGLELTGRPFLAALKPPMNYKTVDSTLPQGFAERIGGRGIIHGGWVQQQQILRHISVGCFITHCGVASLSEAMVSQCQVVLMPQGGDQFINARQMSMDLKIGVKVEQRENDGIYNKEAVCKAVSLVMEEDSEVGREVKANHAKWREFVLTEGLEDSYITSFIQSLQQLLGKP